MFSPRGPSLRELAVQAWSSVQGGYDRLAPKFDHTPFRTPDGVPDATAVAVGPLGPFGLAGRAAGWAAGWGTAQCQGLADRSAQ